VSASVPVLAGSVSTAIFVASTLPMLVKAGRTKDLTSYSLGNIVLANLGNLIYAIYVVSLPLGPVWALHGFHVGATGLMLFWYLRHAGRGRHERRPHRQHGVHARSSTTVDHGLHSATSPNSR
jgi:hypothetical protein